MLSVQVLQEFYVRATHAGLPDPLTPSLPSDSIRLLVLPIARYEVLTNITNLQWCHPPTLYFGTSVAAEASQCGRRPARRTWRAKLT